MPLAMSHRKPDSESVRRGVTVRFKMPQSLYDKIAAAAAKDLRTLPDWIMEQCRDGLAVEKHHEAARGGQ